jgi:hypothetical protein
MAEACSDCLFWRGICEKGKVNRIAWDVACEVFEPKTKEWKVFVERCSNGILQ